MTLKFEEVWVMGLRAMDDIKESVRQSAAKLIRTLRGTTLRLCDPTHTPKVLFCRTCPCQCRRIGGPGACLPVELYGELQEELQLLIDWHNIHPPYLLLARSAAGGRRCLHSRHPAPAPVHQGHRKRRCGGPRPRGRHHRQDLQDRRARADPGRIICSPATRPAMLSAYKLFDPSFPCIVPNCCLLSSAVHSPTSPVV